jgi:two-component system OmpR family response regulator
MANILVVDDEPNILKLVSFFLKSLGYTVFGANNGREALDFCAQNPAKVDLILSDLIMPELGGLELCQALKDKCPVVITSAMSDEANVAQAMAAGAVDFIPKPYALEQIKARLPEILHRVSQV